MLPTFDMSFKNVTYKFGDAKALQTRMPSAFPLPKTRGDKGGPTI